MATRHARLDLSKLSDFLTQWRSSLSQGAVLLPPGTVEGELAPEFKLDVLVPVLGRIGPIPCQIIHRMPDGGVAARMPEMPSKLKKAAERVEGLVEEVREWLVESGALVEPGAQVAAPAEETPPEEGPEQEAFEEDLPEEDLPEEEDLAEEIREEEILEEDLPEEDTAALDAADDEVLDEPPSAAEAPPAFHRDGPRGFPRPTLGEADHAGTLGDRSLRDALIALAVRRAVGVLVVIQPDGVERLGYWSQGGPVGWRSDPLQEGETLGALLGRAKQVDAGTQARAEALMEERGLRLGEALVELGALTAEQRDLVLRRQVEFLFKHVLGLRKGQWRFHTLDTLPDGDFLPPPVHVTSFLFRALAGHAASLPAANLQAALKPREREFVVLNEAFVDLLASGSWTRAEQRLLLSVRRKPTRVVDLIKASGDDALAVGVALLTFVELGLVTLERVAPQGGAAPASEDDAVVARIRKKADRIDTDHDFDVMELHWACLPHELDIAYDRLGKEFNRGAYAKLEGELFKAVEDIASRITQAYNVLRDEARRRRHREEVIDAEMIERTAELFAEKGAAAVEAGEQERAMDCWARALELRPKEPRFQDGLRQAQRMRPR
ncbi:MAG: hypothetical protein H6739_02485 [Alphaproteobacteria bacterium]|nr:hypothetical protein [Alphaproteobacteria bacterium]